MHKQRPFITIALFIVPFFFFAQQLNACGKKDTLCLIENGDCKKVCFSHRVYIEEADSEGYGTCSHVHILEGMARLELMHHKDLLMNDLLADAYTLPETVGGRVHEESNLTRCGESRSSSENIESVDESILYISDGVVSIERDEYRFAAGSAHGMSFITLSTYDRETGMVLGWSDLFPGGKMDRYVLKRIVRELADRDYMQFAASMKKTGKDGNSETATEVLLNFKKIGYFAIVKEGLLIQYSPYEITPHAAGQPSLIVPRATLKKYMTKAMYETCFPGENHIRIVEKCEE